QKAHRFTNLYNLLAWEPLLIWAFHTLMTNRGSRTAGIDGMDKRTAIKHQADILMELRADLKARAYRPQPVRRVYIPKANGKQRPLGIPIWASYCLSFQGVFGILSVVPLVDRGNRSTIRALLYHMLPLLTS